MTVRKRSLLHALNNAVEGFIHVVKTERNMRIHFLCAFLLLFAAFFVGVRRGDWLLLCMATCLVLIAEMINTAIELTLDLLHPKYDARVGLIKDISAGMVLVSVVNALLMGFFVFSKYWRAPFELMATRLRHSAGYLLFISVLAVVFLVVYSKTLGKKGTPFRGGVVSGHSAVAFSLWTVLVFSETNIFVVAVGLLLALLVAQSRLRSKIHSFWEVVAGAVAGISVTAFFFKMFL